MRLPLLSQQIKPILNLKILDWFEYEQDFMYPYLVKNIGIFNARKLTTGNTRRKRNVDVFIKF